MRIVLHIGMAKAGSTALQSGLSSLRKALREAGVLYPASPLVKSKQPLLIAAVTPADHLPRLLHHKIGAETDSVDALVESWFMKVAKAIRTVRPAVLLLSDEWLFKLKDAGRLESLDRRLRSLGDQVDVVAYVRRPSAHYLSMLQQSLKASHRIRQPAGTAYCATLEGYAEHVADTLRVFPYDRAAWPGGDILRHLLDQIVPGAGLPFESVQQRPNHSLSAEAMSILAAYRAAFWPDHGGRFTPDTRRLVQALRAADAELGGSRRPQLWEPVRRYVDQASTDLLALRDHHGITFDGIDYDTVGKLPDMPPPARTVEDVCQVDAARKAELALRTIGKLSMDAV